MPGYSDPGFDTLALHAGASPDPATGARAVPIHLTTSFVFESSDHAASLFNLERGGHVYSRISNPTNAVLEQRVAALEGGVGSIATASGQAALHLAIATLMGAGSHIVASTALYGGSQNLLHYTLSRFGIETTFVKPGDIDGWRAAVRSTTRLFFGETVGNPGLDVLDIPTVSSIAHDAGVPLLVDSTLTSPWLVKPFEHGADLVYHSATKFLSGHGTVVGGIVVDGGSFDWDGPKSAGKFAELTQPYDGFHNMVFTEESTVGAFLLRARREGLRDFGACMSPHTQQKGAHGALFGEHHVVKAIVGLGQFGKFASGFGAIPVKTAAVHHDAAHHCAVPAQELGGRVVDQVSPLVERFDEVGGGEGGVHQQRHTGFVCNGRHGGGVQHIQPGVAHGFAEEEFGVGPHGGAPGVDVAGFDKRGVDAEAAHGVVQQVL